MNKMAKKNNKSIYLGLLLIIVALFFAFNFINSGEDEIKVDGVANFGNIGDFSSQSEGINDRTGGQAFVFTGDSELKSSNYVNFKTLGGYGPYLYVANAGIETGKECPSGSAIRFLKCEGTTSSMSCSKDLFDDMWYKTSSSDLIKFDTWSWLSSQGEFYYAYMCYSYEEGEPQYSLKTALYNGKCYPYAEVKSVGGIDYGTEAKCQEALSGGSSSVINTDSKYGYFKDFNIPKSVETYEEIKVTATFVPNMDFNGLLIETAINQQSFQPLSVVESEISACDGSRYSASKFINVRKGVPVDIEFTINSGGREGKFNVDIYAVKGCYSDVGWDSNSQDNIQSKQITVYLREEDNNDDWDNDGVPNSGTIDGKFYVDNCPYVYNPFADGTTKQIDTDGDGIGNACDFCPLDKGIHQLDFDKYPNGYYLGCHPCESLPENDVCWDKNYPDEIFTDPRYNEDGSESGEGVDYKQTLDDYMEQLIKQAEAQLEEQCIANGGEYLGDGKCEKKTTPTVTLSDEEKCKSKNWQWIENTCINPTIVEEDACKEVKGTWEDNECVIDIDIVWEDETKDIDKYYCGDNICSLGESATSCPIDCNTDKSCNLKDINTITCPDGTQIVGEVCLDGIFTKTDKTCDISSSDGFIKENAGILTTGVVVVLGILGAVFLL